LQFVAAPSTERSTMHHGAVYVPRWCMAFERGLWGDDAEPDPTAPGLDPSHAVTAGGPLPRRA